MANPSGLQDYDFDPQNSQFHYGPRLTWPMQNPESSSAPASAAMIIKRSTSPLPLAIEEQSYHQSATYPPAAAILPGDWVTQAAAPVPFQLDTASFAQHAFDEAYGQSFNTSPTDYLPQQSGLEPAMDASLNAGISLDGSYVTLSSNLGGMNEMGDMNQAGMSGLGDINQMPIGWAEDVGMGYTYGNLQEMIARQQQQQPPPPVTAMSSPGETYLSDNHEVQSLSSSDNGWALIEPTHAHTGTIFNPPQALHPRTFSDSSCSDTEQHSHNSFDGYVEVSNSVSSPSTNSTSEMNFQSDHEPYYEFERQSPPVAPTTALVKPSNMQQTSAASSPQRSPTYPNARRPSRKAPNMKSGSASSKTSIRRPSQIGKTETEKKIGRRTGPLRPDQRKQASEIRKLGACIRCRFLKKTVSSLLIESRDIPLTYLDSVTKAIRVAVASPRTPVCGWSHVLGSTSRISATFSRTGKRIMKDMSLSASLLGTSRASRIRKRLCSSHMATATTCLYRPARSMYAMKGYSA